MTTASGDRPFERLLLQFYGPADLVDEDAPAHVYEHRAEVCPTCGRDPSTHPVTRDPVLGSVSECPGPDPA